MKIFLSLATVCLATALAPLGNAQCPSNPLNTLPVGSTWAFQAWGTGSGQFALRPIILAGEAPTDGKTGVKSNADLTLGSYYNIAAGRFTVGQGTTRGSSSQPAGTLAISDTSNGQYGPNRLTYSGVYSLNADCTGGFLQFAWGGRPQEPSFDFFFTNAAKTEMFLASTSNSLIMTGIAKLVQ